MKIIRNKSISRHDVVVADKRRCVARQNLLGSSTTARHELNPKKLLDRWIIKQNQRLSQFAYDAKAKAKLRSPQIAVVGIATLIFANRDPISNLVCRILSKIKMWRASNRKGN